MKYMICYDLKGPEKDYQALYDELDCIGALPMLDSQWIFKARNTNVKKLMTHFRDFIDTDDILLIIKIVPYGWAASNTPFRVSDL